MSKPVGGRGNKAPYESTHIRVPVPIKDQIEIVIEDYKEAVTQDINLLTTYQINRNSNSLTSLDDAKEIAKRIIRSKKSASQSVAKLLSELYRTEVTVEELKDSVF